tara:strand:- start:299 stop:1174 length:876 start_codon:yes stop_codon:yes gene_type:complete
MLTKLIEFFKNLFSSKQTVNIAPALDMEPEITELVPDNAEIGLDDSQETTRIGQNELHEEVESKIEIKVSASPEETPPEGALSRADNIVRLCAKSETLTDVDSKTYPKGDAEPKSLAHEIDRIRVGLAQDILDRLDSHNSSILSFPPIERQKFKSGQWRSYTWIDFLYETDSEGNAIDYDFVAKNVRGAHLFRIWFTADGVGVGIRPGAHRNHLTREKLIAALPQKFEDLQPSAGNKHESFYPLRLKGRPGQKNQYFAVWYSMPFREDEKFFETINENWGTLGEILNRFRC